MTSSADEMKRRTKQFALRTVRLVQSVGSSEVGRTLGKQLLRAGTSVGANYRAACRARSGAEFRSKLGVVEEECDESVYWIELLIEAGLVKENLVNDLLNEADEILRIVVASIKTSNERND